MYVHRLAIEPPEIVASESAVACGVAKLFLPRTTKGAAERERERAWMRTREASGEEARPPSH